MSEKIVDKIEDYLDIHAPSEVLARGEKLFKEKRVESAEINKVTGSANFEVRGTSLYVVVVSGLTEHIKSYCTCPYDWGPVCKHQVAALRHAQEEFGGRKETEKVLALERAISSKTKKDFEAKQKQKAVPKSNLRNSSTPFLITDYQLITNDIIEKYTSNFWYDESGI